MNSKLLAVVASGALALPLTAQAVEFSVSGQLGRMIDFVEGPGEPASGPNWMHSDLDASGSRFRFTGSGEAADGLTAGVNLEYAVGTSPTLRHSNLNFSGDFGSLAVGHTATATNGTNHDLSKSGLALDLACSNAAVSSCTGWTAGRMGTVTYTTPAVGAATFTGALARDFWDAKITATGAMGGGSYAVSASYAESGSDTSDAKNRDNATYSVAAAFKVAAGASMAAQWGTRDNDSGADKDGFVVKLGYDWGNTGVGALFQRADNGDGTEPSTWGLGVQHNLPDAGVDFFAGYYSHNPDTAADDTTTFSIGSKIVFN